MKKEEMKKGYEENKKDLSNAISRSIKTLSSSFRQLKDNPLVNSAHLFFQCNFCHPCFLAALCSHLIEMSEKRD